jgi:excisionase family DNA binding protein
MPDAYLTTKDLELKYKVSRATIKKWRDNGMPSSKKGKIIRFKETDVDQWWEKSQEQDNKD